MYTVEDTLSVLNSIYEGCIHGGIVPTAKELRVNEMTEGEVITIKRYLTKRNILKTLSKGRYAKYLWNPDYAKPNKSMAKSIYEKIAKNRPVLTSATVLPKVEVIECNLSDYTIGELLREVWRRVKPW